MSLHDGYARVTPYELVFGGRTNAEALVAAVEEESAGRGADPEDPHAFVTMGAVGAFVRELEASDAPPGAIHQYGALAFHGVHFTRADCPLFLLSTHVVRYLVDGAPRAAVEPPSRAGYLQLPQHLFWTDAGADVPESVDGIFWSGTTKGILHSMIVAGMRPDRAGLGVVPLPEAPLCEAETWLEADARGDGSDFASLMPGSEIDRLYAFTTSGEVLKLLARFFAYVQSVPEALQRHDAGSMVGDAPSRGGGEHGPEPSRLPFTRVTLESHA